MKRYLPFIIVGAALLATISLGVALYRAHRQPAVALTGDPGAEPAHSRGDVTAPAVLEEFGDFQCPPCGSLAPEIDKLEKDYGRKLRVVFREYPLVMHKHAEAAARAVEAAALQARFWEMHHMLYETQAVWSAPADAQPLFDGYAAKLGLDVARFKADMKSDKVTARLAADKRRAASLKVDSTPTLFVNNQRIQAGAGTVDRLHAAIDAAIKKK
jgi:protein-disulfide isomerase